MFMRVRALLPHLEHTAIIAPGRSGCAAARNSAKLGRSRGVQVKTKMGRSSTKWVEGMVEGMGV